MRFLIALLSFLFSLYPSFAQENERVVKVLDSAYREDQFYVGFTFNILVNRPEGVAQSGFSGGVHLGFIRDMPLNGRRNIALGIGLGYSGNTYNQNLSITENTARKTLFGSLERGTYENNRFTTNLVEIPLEFRWRTSTPGERKFWRIYTGARLGYLHGFKSVWNQDGIRSVQTLLPELERLRMAATFTFGWNTFNFHFYYSFNSFFNNEAVLDDMQQIGINPIKIGLLFYIL